MAEQNRPYRYEQGIPRGGSPEGAVRTAPGGPVRRGLLGGGLKIGRLFGIEINLHVTVLIIFGLILFSLGASTFPSLHAEWSPGLMWGVAFATAVLFFVSLLAHEMAHSLVAKWRGMEINRITLFLFGGVSELKTQPPTAATEFLVAIAGPLMSVVIGVASWVAASLLIPAGIAEGFGTNTEAALAAVGPLPTMLLWLGLVNLFLAAFNMVPGFPLDGGRVLRSILWGITKDLRKATRWAAGAGKVVAFGLMGLGVFEIVMGGFINGLWLLFIAWFLYGAARNAYSETVLQDRLKGLTVGDLMDTSFDTVSADSDVETFVVEKLTHRPQPVWPVMHGGGIIGTIAIEQVSALPAEARAGTRVGQIMRLLTENEAITADQPGQQALEKLSQSDRGVLVVTRNGSIAGLLTQFDVARWLSLFSREVQPA